MPDLRMVSEQSPEDVATNRAREMLNYPLAELAANLIRIVRGAGAPERLIVHLGRVVESFHEYRKASGHWPETHAIAKALRPESDYEYLSELANGPVHDRWLADGTFTRAHAADKIRAGALQVAASKLLGQRTQQVLGENELHEGLRLFEKAQAEMRAARLRELVPSGTKAQKKKKAVFRRHTRNPEI